MFAAQAGLQDPDQGPVLDDSWPTVVRTEVRDNLTAYPALAFKLLKCTSINYRLILSKNIRKRIRLVVS